MTEEQKISFAESMKSIYDFINRTLKADGKCYEFRWRSTTYTVDQPFTEAEIKKRDKVCDKIAKFLIRDAFNVILKDIYNDDYFTIDKAFDRIDALKMFEPIEYYAREKIKAEDVYIPDLDADGKSINSKPLNHGSVYVQWQNQNKFKFSENDNV
jgi:hypothetical protein